MDAIGTPTNGKGNLTLKGCVEDNGEPGVVFDRFRVNTGYGQRRMSKSPSIRANAATLAGGIIKVPRGK